MRILRGKVSLSWKNLLASGHDAVMAVGALLIALIARYGDDVWQVDPLLLWLLLFAVTCFVVFQIFGLGRGMWRFASITDLRTIVLGSSIAIVVYFLLLFSITRLEGFPRTALPITWFVMIVLIGAPRLAYRAFKDGGLTGIRPRDLADHPREDILIVGAVSDADQVIRSYRLENSTRYRVHGIVDIKPGKSGRRVRGVPVVGDVGELADIVPRMARAGTSINALVLASPSVSGDWSALLQAATELQLPLRRVAAKPLTGTEPDLAELTLEDLLSRPSVKLAIENIENLIRDRVILITGAGGSIGSEIVRQVARHGPKHLVLFDLSEYALYEIDHEIARDFPQLSRAAILGDVRDAEQMRRFVSLTAPSVIFHAAARKHVPLIEANPCDGIATNVFGTRNLADAAVEAGVDAFVMISTDKAIRPTSTMGASKRVAELYCQARDVAESRTRFVTVRFGNVLGSTGSVVPLFRRQILAGGPVTVTHPEMKRYFMTIPEATQLVLQAAATGIEERRTRGRIMVLDMGQPVRIIDLARSMIVLAGLRPDQDIEIRFTGLRSGEKLFEELFDPTENPEPSGVAGVFVASPMLAEAGTLQRGLAALQSAVSDGDGALARSRLFELVPEPATDHVAQRRAPAY
jgi:FlaA1/EpsC-like NDP-sugar epimerase